MTPDGMKRFLFQIFLLVRFFLFMWTIAGIGNYYQSCKDEKDFETMAKMGTILNLLGASAVASVLQLISFHVFWHRAIDVRRGGIINLVLALPSMILNAIGVFWMSTIPVERIPTGPRNEWPIPKAQIGFLALDIANGIRLGLIIAWRLWGAPRDQLPARYEPVRTDGGNMQPSPVGEGTLELQNQIDERAGHLATIFLKHEKLRSVQRIEDVVQVSSDAKIQLDPLMNNL
jgi:hypothetical protein